MRVVFVCRRHIFSRICFWETHFPTSNHKSAAGCLAFELFFLVFGVLSFYVCVCRHDELRTSQIRCWLCFSSVQSHFCEGGVWEFFFYFGCVFTVKSIAHESTQNPWLVVWHLSVFFLCMDICVCVFMYDLSRTSRSRTHCKSPWLVVWHLSVLFFSLILIFFLHDCHARVDQERIAWLVVWHLKVLFVLFDVLL